ncbi:MAG: GGDEF domain-containing protein [Colwellia sp.]
MLLIILSLLLSIVVNVVIVLRLENYKKMNASLIKEQAQTKEEFEYQVQERTLTLNIALKELEEANQALAKKSQTDKLTGLNNRACYDDTIQAEYRRSKRTLSPLSLIVIDIDHFKLVNDNYGHFMGDKCLIWFAAMIKKSVKRDSDVAFRYGGEEFCLLLPSTDAKGAYGVAESLRKNIETETFEYNNIIINITVSCGVFTYEQQKDIKLEDLFTFADKALYQAKSTGRNKAVAFELNNELVQQ